MIHEKLWSIHSSLKDRSVHGQGITPWPQAKVWRRDPLLRSMFWVGARGDSWASHPQPGQHLGIFLGCADSAAQPVERSRTLISLSLLTWAIPQTACPASCRSGATQHSPRHLFGKPSMSKEVCSWSLHCSHASLSILRMRRRTGPRTTGF